MDSNNFVTILIVDDHPVVRDGLSAMLATEPDFQIIGHAATGAEAMALYFKLRPAIILMDLVLPDMNGTEAIQKICQKSSDVGIIVLTTLSGDEEIYQAIEAGARGYLLKDMVRRELVQAIHEVFAGRRYIPAQVGKRIAESLPRPDLTSREVDVLRMVASGLRSKEVAYELNISEATVNAHVKHILFKLNASDRTHAVMVALRRGIIRL